MTMHPTTRTTLVSMAIGLLTVFLAVGVSAGATGQFASHGALTTAQGSQSAHSAPAVQPAVDTSCPGFTANCIQYAPAVGGYNTLPYAVNGYFNLTNTHGFFNASDTIMWATVSNFTGVVLATFDLNSTIPVTSTNQSTFSFSINETTIGCAATNCANIAQTPYSIVTHSVIHNSTILLNTTGIGTTYFVTVPLSVSLGVSAAAVGTTSSVNITFTALYTGQYVTGVTVTVFSPTNASVVVFTAPLVNSQGVSTPASFVTTSGSYPASVSLVTAGGTTVVENSTVAAFAQVNTVYSNSTSWHNQTFFGGLSPAVAGTLLLVVGLIIGLIVAMVLGRMVWGTTKPAPAQPWTDAKTANTCSVCGKSFATPEELAAHGKSEHGMQ
jgi:hypothetical protein